jgi:phasin family protein
MATAAETAKATAERFAETSNQAFKESVEKSMATFADMNTHAKRNMEAVVASVTAATKGAETLGAQAMAFSKKSVEDQVAAAKTLTSAKSLQEAVELQTSFAKTSLDAYLAELNKWSDIVSGSVRESLRPINERVSAAVEQFQTAR